MSDFPKYNMYALVKDNYIVDAVFGGPETFWSARNQDITYSINDGYTPILVTLENSPFVIGDYFETKEK